MFPINPIVPHLDRQVVQRALFEVERLRRVDKDAARFSVDAKRHVPVGPGRIEFERQSAVVAGVRVFGADAREQSALRPIFGNLHLQMGANQLPIDSK